MNVDSRDYLFLADPLDALVRVLSQEDYIGAEFVGIVTESIALGSFGGLSVDYGDLVNQCAQEWLGLACGPKCYAHLSLMSYTNGEPYATLNSGQMLGTAIGMLHYYRFHSHGQKYQLVLMHRFASNDCTASGHGHRISD
eukprot:GDKK01003045.1.p1 GENE.GDKK01003045.1~~GDKK01003045.1.p1  ORF type:complete len:152 (-),score=4.09 GDKK01003045.1:202-621(-)